MNKQKNKIQVLRISYSKYHKSDFLSKEQNAILKINKRFEVITSSLTIDPKKDLIVLTNTHTNFDDLKDYKNLKLVIHTNSGHDNITTAFAANKNITTIVGNPIRADAVTEYILSAFFTRFIKIPNSKAWDYSRLWDRELLKNKNVLIIGHGFIGSRVNKTLRTLKVKTYIYDPFYKTSKLPNLSKIDAVIVAASLNPTSFHLIDEMFLRNLKKDALIINASRGQIIDQKALISFLVTHPKSHAFLDVFETEPCNFSDFKDLKNITLTSHIAGVYDNLDQDIIDFESKVLSHFVGFTKERFKQKYKNLILKNRLKKFGKQTFLI